MKKIPFINSAFYLLTILSAAFLVITCKEPETCPYDSDRLAAKLTIIHINDAHGRTFAEPYISRMVKDIKAAGAPFDVDKRYTVATIEFLAAGGDGYAMMLKGQNLVYYGGDVDAFVSHLSTNPEIRAEPEGRVRTVER